MSERINARAFTLKNHVFFNRGEFSPTRHDGRRLIAHELSHAFQRLGTRNDAIIRRDIKFHGGTESLRTKVVEETGAVRESNPLIDEFIRGLKEFFDIDAVIDDSVPASAGYVSVTLKQEKIKSKAEGSEERVKKVEDNLTADILKLRTKHPRLVVPRPRDARESNAGGRSTNDFKAVTDQEIQERYLFVRDVLINRLAKATGYDLVDKLTVGGVDIKPGGTEAPIRYENPGGPFGEHVQVATGQYRDMQIHKRSGWDGFWILTHEILHDAGLKDDAGEGPGAKAAADSRRKIDLRRFTNPEERTATSRHEKLWTTIGDPEYALNMVRLLRGKPLRTGYLDENAVRFSDFSAPLAEGGSRVAVSTSMPDTANFEYEGATMQGGEEAFADHEGKLAQASADHAKKRDQQRHEWRIDDRMLTNLGKLSGTFNEEQAEFSAISGFPGAPPEYLTVKTSKDSTPLSFAIRPDFLFDGKGQATGFMLKVGGDVLSFLASDAREFAERSRTGPIQISGTLNQARVVIRLNTPM